MKSTGSRPSSPHALPSTVDAWRDDAACRDVPKAVFYEARHFEQARNVCAVCPWWVREACLAEVMEDEGSVLDESRFGFRGGLTERQRYLLYRRLTRKARLAVAS